MWNFISTALNDNVHKITLYKGELQLKYDDVIRNWLENSEFREFYILILKKSPYKAFFWENPPTTTSTSKQMYEFVLVNSLQLARVSADSGPFQEKFKTASSSQSVIAFENLRRDAELIVPRPANPQSDYAHFASFLRNAPEGQVHELFVMLASSLSKRINNKPTWVSTSGLGVYWLHIRLDTIPKYYSYEAYRNFVVENSGE